MRLAHVTDLHFGAEQADVVAGLRRDLLTQGLDRVLVGGDLTMRARDRQFAAARELLEALGTPWTSVPGNHDLPLDRPVRAYGSLDSYRRLVGPPESVVRDGGLLLLGLSSPRAYLWKGGRVDAGQVTRIETELAPDAELKVLMLHHPVFPSPQRPGEALAHGAQEVLRAAASVRADLVLCGHEHVAAQVRLPGGVIGVLSGTACSWRVRAGEPQSYTVIDVEGDRLTITVRHWRDGAFTEASTTVWRRSRDGWQA
ncbi:metallophosphoesterase family protein [Paractinoplanes brasiliensis]|uniref:3',5'-cyclic AMP phosphodiesterase CpdA n=1 Tax=Paractinoplanes brasiliensis TaxID=52695 RepID=A0A4R6JCT0_9ACTN|nr:metallophosphoesterase [Actinoplanes brasiliensis]TDO32761.1 3',5'-cyclic AMP phosphodiesterase CpdA [Actinoplanes brasiliensis]GID31696.1 metallophosphoesterase [Actinoplanes brasiliensis]